MNARTLEYIPGVDGDQKFLFSGHFPMLNKASFGIKRGETDLLMCFIIEIFGGVNET